MINNGHQERFLQFQYKATFEQDIPETLLNNPRVADLTISYGKMGYDEKQAFFLAENHIKITRFNFLMTDDIVFSLHKKTL